MADLEKTHAETEEELRQWVIDCKENLDRKANNFVLCHQMLINVQKGNRKALRTYKKRADGLAAMLDKATNGFTDSTSMSDFMNAMHVHSEFVSGVAENADDYIDSTENNAKVIDYCINGMALYYNAVHDYQQALNTYVKTYGELPDCEDEDDEDECND